MMKEKEKETMTIRLESALIAKKKLEKNKIKVNLLNNTNKASASTSINNSKPQSLNTNTDQKTSNNAIRNTKAPPLTKIFNPFQKSKKNKNLNMESFNEGSSNTVRKGTSNTNDNQIILKNSLLDTVISQQQANENNYHVQVQSTAEVEKKHSLAVPFNNMFINEQLVIESKGERNQPKFINDSHDAFQNAIQRSFHKKNALSLNINDDRHNSMMYYRVVNNDTDSENTNDINNFGSVISDYLESGTATKKFDGVSFKVNSKEIKVCFEGGLNATNKIKPPMHLQVENKKGDIPID